MAMTLDTPFREEVQLELAGGAKDAHGGEQCGDVERKLGEGGLEGDVGRSTGGSVPSGNDGHGAGASVEERADGDAAEKKSAYDADDADDAMSVATVSTSASGSDGLGTSLALSGVNSWRTRRISRCFNISRR
jgi:hypothetical protein